jgi:hypothetical protein
LYWSFLFVQKKYILHRPKNLTMDEERLSVETGESRASKSTEILCRLTLASRGRVSSWFWRIGPPCVPPTEGWRSGPARRPTDCWRAGPGRVSRDWYRGREGRGSLGRDAPVAGGVVLARAGVWHTENGIRWTQWGLKVCCDVLDLLTKTYILYQYTLRW